MTEKIKVEKINEDGFNRDKYDAALSEEYDQYALLGNENKRVYLNEFPLSSLSSGEFDKNGRKKSFDFSILLKPRIPKKKPTVWNKISTSIKRRRSHLKKEFKG